MKKTSIKKRILIIAMSISLASVLVVSLISATGMFFFRSHVIDISSELGATAAADSKDALKEMIFDSLLILAVNNAGLSDSTLRAVQDITEITARNATQILHTEEGASLTENMQNFLLNVAEQHRGVLSVFMGTNAGDFVVIDQNISVSEDLQLDPRERPWFVLAQETGTTTWTDVYVSALYGLEMITCVAPIYDSEGNFAGAIGMGMFMESLSNIVMETKIGETGYAFMMNQAGQVIISDDIQIFDNNEIYSRHTYLALALKSVAVGSRGGVIMLEIDGIESIAAYAALDTLPWFLVTVIEADEVIAPALYNAENITALMGVAQNNINSIITYVISLLIVFIAMITVIIVFITQKFTHSLTHPITMLRESVHEIAAGNLDYTLNINPIGDEIEDLGLSVKKMAKDLKEHIHNLTKVTAEKERIDAELSIATQIQASMLPSIFPPYPHCKEFDLYATMLPAKEVGGDFFDFFMVDATTLAVVVADVSGKGVPAALFMVITKTLIKNNACSGKSPKEVFETVNRLLCENNEANMFVTAFMGYLDVTSGKFTYVNAGHNPPLVKKIKKAGGDYSFLKTKSCFILAGLESAAYKEEETTLSSGDILYLYTDGVTEAMNNEYELFSDARLQKATDKYKECSIHELLNGIKEEIDTFAEGAEQADDITMLALKYAGAAKHELLIEAKLENMDAVLDFVNEQLADCPPKVQNQIGIAVDEVFSNIARYAYHPTSGAATVRISVDENIIIEFEDSGIAYDPLSADTPNIELSADEREIGGLGVLMLKKLMDSVVYKREGDKNILTVIKKNFELRR